MNPVGCWWCLGSGVTLRFGLLTQLHACQTDRELPDLQSGLFLLWASHMGFHCSRHTLSAPLLHA